MPFGIENVAPSPDPVVGVEKQVKVLACLSQEEAVHDVCELLRDHVLDAREAALHPGDRLQRRYDLLPDVQIDRVVRRLVHVHRTLCQLRPQRVAREADALLQQIESLRHGAVDVPHAVEGLHGLRRGIQVANQRLHPGPEALQAAEGGPNHEPTVHVNLHVPGPQLERVGHRRVGLVEHMQILRVLRQQRALQQVPVRARRRSGKGHGAAARQ